MAGRLPFSRIRCPRVSPNPLAVTAEAHQASHRIAYADPDYPPEAKAKGIEGKVALDVLIGKDGIVQTVEVRTGEPLLAEAAVQAVRHWTYRPTAVNGIPVEVATEVELSFTLP